MVEFLLLYCSDQNPGGVSRQSIRNFDRAALGLRVYTEQEDPDTTTVVQIPTAVAS